MRLRDCSILETPDCHRRITEQTRRSRRRICGTAIGTSLRHVWVLHGTFRVTDALPFALPMASVMKTTQLRRIGWARKRRSRRGVHSPDCLNLLEGWTIHGGVL